MCKKGFSFQSPHPTTEFWRRVFQWELVWSGLFTWFFWQFRREHSFFRTWASETNLEQTICILH